MSILKWSSPMELPRPTDQCVNWCSDPAADNDETLEPYLDEGFESELVEDDE
jgi:hypothetical protein